jgi:hypothetical protein
VNIGMDVLPPRKCEGLCSYKGQSQASTQGRRGFADTKRMQRTFLVTMAAVMVAIGLAAQSAQQQQFSYAGIGLGSDFDATARRYPHSSRVGSYIYVAPEDSRDHVGGIGISEQQVVISFGVHVGSREQYPPCAEIEKPLIQQYGRPESIREFDEEAVRRADRHWSSLREEMTLICFIGPRRQLLAEGVKISPR